MKDLISLLDLRRGERGVIVSIQGGRGVIQRLSDMGLTPGTEVSVTNSAFFGPIEISVRGSKLALGRGIAMKILVERK